MKTARLSILVQVEIQLDDNEPLERAFQSVQTTIKEGFEGGFDLYEGLEVTLMKSEEKK